MLTVKEVYLFIFGFHSRSKGYFQFRKISCCYEDCGVRENDTTHHHACMNFSISGGGVVITIQSLAHSVKILCFVAVITNMTAATAMITARPVHVYTHVRTRLRSTSRNTYPRVIVWRSPKKNIPSSCRPNVSSSSRARQDGRPPNIYTRKGATAAVVVVVDA